MSKVIGVCCDSCGQVGFNTEGVLEFKLVRKAACDKLGWKTNGTVDLCSQCAEAQEATRELPLELLPEVDQTPAKPPSRT
jgi:hypothetical protein